MYIGFDVVTYMPPSFSKIYIPSFSNRSDAMRARVIPISNTLISTTNHDSQFVSIQNKKGFFLYEKTLVS